MVAVVKAGASIRRTFYYNEHKVDALIEAVDEKGKVTLKPAAVLLLAANYPMDLEAMNRQQRLNMLLKTAEKRPTVKKNSLHISLNFAPGEKLSEALLKQIAGEYMDAIGFGGQPYLVYQHHDAGHPHLHIVTLRTRPDGTLINTYKIGANASNKARLMLEKKFGLVEAQQHKRDFFRLPPVDAAKVHYGQAATKRQIVNVLDWVLTRYKYASLASLNAVLEGYHIRAERGSENSRIYKNRGLVYRALSPTGKPLGIQIPASHIWSKPTLSFLEKRFKDHCHFTAEERTRVKNAIDLSLKKVRQDSLTGLTRDLQKDKIRLVIHRNQDRIYGLTYVDLVNKCVFKGADLGTNYSAKAVLERCAVSAQQAMQQPSRFDHHHNPPFQPPELGTPTPAQDTISVVTTLMEELIGPEMIYDPVPYPLRARKKKKKKKQQPDNP
ncbi:relaxase/mobilization nuclease domain-containing protein [Chitinophaga sp. Ak27]|uniref:relaxase/mobilization nuclease domain-containing protein n=1 Tax=Chitinophaga sp. Ak27 TaxID=2726116 RepID=UPI00145F2B7A|nr:relaxase/mobilization nuclease domain-containing protein [Chitinophaga sp. Ak27]NLU94898.1 relaxase/mobilization nuclease domain-containing protein [Chitinophaga sp. Ak27]